jgi:hypothetical protein
MLLKYTVWPFSFLSIGDGDDDDMPTRMMVNKGTCFKVPSKPSVNQ